MFRVRGGAALRGTLRVFGAKNSALKLMAAAVMTSDEVVLTNVPRIADVPAMVDLLVGIGCSVTSDDGRVAIRAAAPHWAPDPQAVRRFRASLATLGPLLARCGRVRLVLPGGDDIGARGIDLHLRGLAELGADIVEVEGGVEVRADKLRGAPIVLDFPSVGATENIVMAAVLADGLTELDNAAREPEIQDLCRLLNAMGAGIEGIGSATLRIEGVSSLHGVQWATCPDRIETGTWLMAAAMTGGDITLEAVDPEVLRLPLMKLAEAGVELDVGATTIRASAAPGALRPVNFVTLPWPGFPTDLQPQMMVLLTQAHGTSMCTENVFESRYAFVEQLRRTGADVELDGHHALIRGPIRLHGAQLDGLDVRAGMAGILAGLIADGETWVLDSHHVDRGYADVVARLRSLGGDVERMPASATPPRPTQSSRA